MRDGRAFALGPSLGLLRREQEDEAEEKMRATRAEVGTNSGLLRFRVRVSGQYAGLCVVYIASCLRVCPLPDR